MEHKIQRKAGAIPPDLLIQTFGRNPIKFGQIAVQHDFMPADQQNATFYLFNKKCLLHGTTQEFRSSARY